MTDFQLQLYLWIDFERKIISFRQLAGGERVSFENRDVLLAQLDTFSSQGFRFQ